MSKQHKIKSGRVKRSLEQAWSANASEMMIAAHEYAVNNVSDLEDCIDQNKVQWLGMIIAFKKHGQNLDMAFMINHCQEQIDKCAKALGT